MYLKRVAVITRALAVAHIREVLFKYFKRNVVPITAAQALHTSVGIKVYLQKRPFISCYPCTAIHLDYKLDRLYRR